MIRVVTPQGELLAKLENSAVAAYLRERGLVGRKKSTSAEVDAFAPTIEAHLLEMKKPSSKSSIVIWRFDRTRIRSLLAEGKTVYLNIKPRELRHFYTRQCFFDVMQKFAEEERPVEVVIPAGRYGDLYAFALRKPSL